MEKKQIVLKVYEMAGGQTALAKKLTEKTGEEITQWRVQKWQYKGIPADFILPVHEITSIPLYELDPVRYPPELFSNAVHP